MKTGSRQDQAEHNTHLMIVHPRSPSEVVGTEEDNVTKVSAPVRMKINICDEGDDDDTAGYSVCSTSPAAVEDAFSPSRDFQKYQRSTSELEMKTNDDHQVDDLYMCKQSNTRLSSVAPRPLKSALRSSVAVGSNARKKGLPWKLAGRPRVHGLWSEDKAMNPFALLHDSLLLEILASFLNLEDLCRCQGVSQRFATLSQRDEAWQRIDATSFVQSLYHFFKRSKHLHI